MRSLVPQAVPTSIKAADWQKVRLQELLSVSQQGPQGAAARAIEAELAHDCVRSCKCGDDVSVLGFVRAMSVDAGAGGKSGSGLMLMYLEAVSVSNHTAPRGETLAQVRAHPPHCKAAHALCLCRATRSTC